MANKYNASKIVTPHGTFDSMAEYRQWQKLNVLRGATDPRERVTDIRTQVTYQLPVNGHVVTTYRADFVVTFADGRIEIQDVKNPYLMGKGKSTPAGQIFQIKRKLMHAIHGIEITVI